MSWKSAPTASGVVTSPFGPRKPIKTAGGMTSSTHQGADYRAATGTNVHACGDGVVTAVARHDIRGLYVTVRHLDGTSTLAQHLSSTDNVKVGQQIAGGTIIGKAGKTGRTTGPHVHLEMFGADGKRFDPVPALAARVAAQKPAPAPTPTPAPTKPAPATGAPRAMSFGSQGADVAELQRVLNRWYPARKGFPGLVVDGVFGGKTRDRVIYLQAKAGLARDGIAGKDVRRVLGL